MAAVSRTSLSKAEHDELSCVFAALILHDDGLEITADKLSKILTTSGNQVEKYWPTLFANALKGQDLARLLSNLGAGGSAPAGSAAQAGTTAATEQPKQEEKKEEPAEEEVVEGAMDLFGGDEW
ncbi:unnamed protein product [Blepharisma stoltei]|uniref:60S acidic ribosomal protein P1 n=1 Tax=Blepharisma stoltei TaxID=1481888 RepID=A0AAU9IKG7_9CILI|nr:unnamed protein product [Blepharisma stoltei]